MPGQEKMVSVSTAPPSSAPICRPTTVSTGISALRSPWTTTTRSGDSPRARAVRMKSSRSTSSSELRVMRAITAIGTVPSTSAGSSRWRSADVKAPASPDNRLSISMKPVRGSMSYSMAMRPDTGVSPRSTEKTMISTRPHQKIGIE